MQIMHPAQLQTATVYMRTEQQSLTAVQLGIRLWGKTLSIALEIVGQNMANVTKVILRTHKYFFLIIYHRICRAHI